jgi:hypothetical protein
MDVDSAQEKEKIANVISPAQ